MAEILLQPQELLAKFAAAVELLVRAANSNSSDATRKEEVKTALNEIKEIKTEDINFALEHNPALRDEISDLHKQVKTSNLYDNIANISLGLVLVLLFAGIAVGTQGNIITASQGVLLPTLGEVIYLAVLPVLVGIVTSWKSQSVLDQNFYPKLARILNDPTNELTLAVENRRKFLQSRNVVEDKVAGVSTEATSVESTKNQEFTPSANNSISKPHEDKQDLNDEPKSDVKPDNKNRL